MSKTCLYNISYKVLPGIYNNQLLLNALVWDNTNFGAVHSRVTVGGSSVECEYKLLRQFTTVVTGHRMPYTSVLSTLYDIAAWSQKAINKRTILVCHSLFAKLVGLHNSQCNNKEVFKVSIEDIYWLGIMWEVNKPPTQCLTLVQLAANLFNHGVKA